MPASGERITGGQQVVGGVRGFGNFGNPQPRNTGSPLGNLFFIRPPRPGARLPGSNVVGIGTGTQYLPQRFPNYDQSGISPGQAQLRLRVKNRLLNDSLRNLKKSLLRGGGLGQLAALRDTGGKAILAYANAQQHYRSAKSALALTAIDRQVMAGRADARASRPNISGMDVARAATLPYLPVGAPAIQKGDKTTSVISKNTSPGVATRPENAPSVRPSVTSPGTAGQPSSQPRPTAASQKRPATSPVTFTAIESALATILQKGLQTFLQVPKVTPSAPFNPAPPRVGTPIVPSVNLTPSKQAGVASSPNQGFAQALNPDLNPEAQLEDNPEKCNCKCKKGEGPKEKCGTGYFRIGTDGRTTYKYWSKKCR
jgi:hypothetical protein